MSGVLSYQRSENMIPHYPSHMRHMLGKHLTHSILEKGVEKFSHGAGLVGRRQFTDTALGFSMTILNAGVDLISFSGILYSIYPPLFVALLIYSIGGTGVSIFLGRKLVGLNFQQEAQEANFR
jgi:hypothetical protein